MNADPETQLEERSEEELLAQAGLRVEEGLTQPTRPGKKPRAVYYVRGNVHGLEDLLRELGGHTWRGEWNFWEDPSAELARQLAEGARRATYQEALEAKRERAEARAERHEGWAQAAEERQAAAFRRADEIAQARPLGQPILVGHHSERHARADQRRIEAAMDRGLEEGAKARYHEGRAAAAERTARAAATPEFCARRIQDAEEALRGAERGLRYAEAGLRRGDDYDGQYAAWKARLDQEKLEAEEKLAYWRAQLAELGGGQVSRADVRPGDLVRHERRWYRVERVNPTSITTSYPLGVGTHRYRTTIKYAELTAVRRAEEAEAEGLSAR